MRCYNLATREGKPLFDFPPYPSIRHQRTAQFLRSVAVDKIPHVVDSDIISPRHLPFAQSVLIPFVEMSVLPSVAECFVGSVATTPKQKPRDYIGLHTSHPLPSESMLMYSLYYTQPNLKTSEKHSPIINHRLANSPENSDLTRREKTYRGLDTSRNCKNLQAEIAFSGVADGEGEGE